MAKASSKSKVTVPDSNADEWEAEYSDEQFEADVQRAAVQIDAMAAKALESLRKGHGRRFPE